MDAFDKYYGLPRVEIKVVGPNNGGYFGEARYERMHVERPCMHGRVRMDACSLDTEYITVSASHSPTYFLSQERFELLEWCELVLARYPSHPETLRAKGSILLMLGEREKAIEVYETVEEIETDPAVRKKLEELQAQGTP